MVYNCSEEIFMIKKKYDEFPMLCKNTDLKWENKRGSTGKVILILCNI